MRFFLDAGVPDAVARAAEDHGHEVIKYRDALVEAVKDDVVAATALASEAVLVAIDGDMSQIARRYGKKLMEDDRFKRLSLVHLRCPEVRAAGRLDQAISLIEHEWAFCKRKTSRRMWIEIGSHHLRTNR